MTYHAFTTIEISRLTRTSDSYSRWFRYYDSLLVAGKSESEALEIVEAAQRDERAAA